MSDADIRNSIRDVLQLIKRQVLLEYLSEILDEYPLEVILEVLADHANRQPNFDQVTLLLEEASKKTVEAKRDNHQREIQ